MKMKEWVDLHSIRGELDGISIAVGMTEEIDLKKLQQSLKDLAQKIKTIADAEEAKLEDIKMSDPKAQPKKPIKKKEPTP